MKNNFKMNKSIYTIAIACCGLVLASCGNNNEPKQNEVIKNGEVTVAATTDHNHDHTAAETSPQSATFNDPQLNAHYAGIIPNKNGKDSIGYHLIIEQNKYELDMKVYTAEGFDGRREVGMFGYNAKTKVLTLPNPSVQFQVNDNSVELLDITGQPFTDYRKVQLMKHVE